MDSVLTTMRLKLFVLTQNYPVAPSRKCRSLEPHPGQRLWKRFLGPLLVRTKDSTPVISRISKVQVPPTPSLSSLPIMFLHSLPFSFLLLLLLSTYLSFSSFSSLHSSLLLFSLLLMSPRDRAWLVVLHHQVCALEIPQKSYLSTSKKTTLPNLY